MKSRYLKASLVACFALCFLTALLFADDRRLSFGGGAGPAAMKLDTNLFVCAGMTTSNSAVATTIWTGFTPITNPTTDGVLGSIYSHTISGNLFQNDGDTLEFVAHGTMPLAQANTNELAIVYGATTILDTGLQNASNTTYRISATLTRSGTNNLQVMARCEFGLGGGGTPFAFTNNVVTIGETNTQDTVFAFKAAARRTGSLTNLFASLRWNPAGK